jgi:hypothetical protein
MESRTQRLLADLKVFAQVGGYSQARLAGVLGVNRSRVSGWFRETDPHLPSLEHGLAIRGFAAQGGAASPSAQSKREG